MDSFSSRHGFIVPQAEITIRQDAPEEMRSAVVLLAEQCGMTPHALREVVCQVLLKKPAYNRNWSDPNVREEVNDLLEECAWWEVYDTIEAIATYLCTGQGRAAAAIKNVDGPTHFASGLNRYFCRTGIGWQLLNGRIEMRGSEAFEDAVRSTASDLSTKGRTTAANELHEAIADLSRRPNPEITGAIQHALAALECLARDVGESKDTLGTLIQRRPDLFPKPLGAVVEQAWGWGSNNGRHLIEGSQPPFEEAELLVGLSGALCRYLKHKLK